MQLYSWGWEGYYWLKDKDFHTDVYENSQANIFQVIPDRLYNTLKTTEVRRSWCYTIRPVSD